MPRPGPAPFPGPPGDALGVRLHAVRALAARHRRLAAAVCAGAAVLAAVSALTPTAPPVSVSGDAAGAGLSPVVLPSGAGAGSVAEARRVAVTVRLADPAGILLLRPGIHVEVIGGAPVGAGAGAGEEAEVLAADAVVLVVPRADGAAGDVGSVLGASGGDGGGGGGGGGGGWATGQAGLDGVAVLSVAPADAHRLAAAAGTRPLSVTVALPTS